MSDFLMARAADVFLAAFGHPPTVKVQASTCSRV
jgi:hypothetical protein